MSGVTPLIDTLLATRLAQRVDLVPLKGQVDIGGTTAPTPLQKVSNDVRLNSREGFQQQIGVGPGADSRSGQGAAGKNADATVSLSVVARALTALLDTPASGPSRLMTTTPLWPDPATPPDPPKLAATLAQAVTGSGLFYEAHLKQFAAGTRTLAQMVDEPQAQLGKRPARGLAGPEAQAATAPMPEKSAAVHPESMGLVRQQLELLAQPLLRWSGQAWPGATLDWDIAEEQDERQGAADDAGPARRWNTRLALSLPALGAVEARLSLDGNTLQLQLRAAEQTTVSLLNAAGTELPGRMDAQGLQLAALHVGGLEAPPENAP
jgi:hypothetical protein